MSENPSALPDLTKVNAEDRDRVWFERYYQGDKVPQLTVRAVIMGGLLGMAMSISNLYTTLKLGWAFGVAITACVLSYAIWNAFFAIGFAKTKMSMLENNCMQSTASAAGYSTGGTLATAAGALLLIGGDEHRMGWVSLTAWVFFVALLGVFLAIPMKRQMINHDQLPFPSGIAAAETLRSLYAEGADALRKARALIGALFVGGVLGLARSFGLVAESLDLPGIMARARGQSFTGAQLGMAFEPSLLLIAAGMITGMRVCTSMLLGALIYWLVLTPLVLGQPDWHMEGKTFLGHMEVALGDGGVIELVKVTRWTLWIGTSILVFSGLTYFALGWRTIVRAFSGFAAKRSTNGGAGFVSAVALPEGEASVAQGLEAIEVPASWMVIGLIPITLGLVAVCWFSFGISPVLGVLSVALAFVLSLVACRATGETDTTPIGAMGKITQLVYAVLAPADKTVNLMTAGVTAGAAGSSADLLIDLKSGYLLGANPKKQFVAQFVGVFFGTVAVIPAWYLMVPDKAHLEAFNPPATNMWYAVAQALANGIDTIPESARVAIAIGALVGVALPVLETLFPKYKQFIPSAMGLGLAGVVSFANSLSFFIGAVIAMLWAKRNEKHAERYVIPLASGAIAGESLAAAAFAILNSLGIVSP